MQNLASIFTADLRNGNTLLHASAAGRNLDVLKFIIETGVNVDLLNSNNETPLHSHVNTGYLSADIIKLLLTHGADSNLISRGGKTILYKCVKYDNYNAVKLLLEYGANVNTPSKPNYKPTITPLMLSLKKYSYNIAKLIMSYNPDINFIDETGRTALYMACNKNSPDTVKLLLERGADVTVNAKNKDHIPMMSVVYDDKTIGIAKLLIKYGADVNAFDGINSVLYNAVWYQSVEIVKLLLSNGADPNMKQNVSCTILELACYKGNIEILRLLIRYNAKAKNAHLFNWARITENTKLILEEYTKMYTKIEALLDLHENNPESYFYKFIVGKDVFDLILEYLRNACF